MSDLKKHVKEIAANLTNPPAEWNEGRDIESEGEFSAFDYLQNVLDIEYIVSGKGEYLGARILVAFGGPNIWVDTRRGMVDGHWWSDSASASFKDNLGLDDALDTRRGMVDGHWWSDSASASFKDNLGLDDALSELWACR